MDDLKKIITEALKSSEPINIDVQKFLDAGIAYSESSMATQFTEGKKLREGFKLDLVHKITMASRKQVVQPRDILVIARDYNLEIWIDYEKNVGGIDTTIKSFFSLEVAEGLKDCGNFDTAGLHEKLLVSTDILYGNGSGERERE